MLTVFGTSKNRAFRVIWALEELGLDYKLEHAMPRDEAIRAVNPRGKVPALQLDDKTVLTDSSAILTYLADCEGRLTFPAGSVERAIQDSKLHMILDEFDAALWVYARHSFALPEEKRVEAIKPVLKWEVAKSAKALSEALQGPYLMGEEFTIADIVAVHCLIWMQKAKFDLPHDNLVDYVTRLSARPAFQRAAAA